MATILPFSASEALDASMADDRPNREIRVGAAIAGLFFIAFLGSAALAPLDAAAIASGQLVVSGHRQTLQHPAGGQVTRVLVREGQHVRRGDVLIELAGVEVRAQARALTAQYVGLLAQRARASAELTGAPTIRWPAEFANDSDLPSDLIADARLVQQQEFLARRSLLGSQQQLLARQSVQARQSVAGYTSQIESSTEQEHLLKQELAGLDDAAAKGFVSLNHLREMQRQRAEIHGRAGMDASNVAQAEVAVEASQLKRIEAQKSDRERAADELRQVGSALADATPRYIAARQQLDQLDIRAPVDGTVVGLVVFAGETVIGTGQPLMDIVPDHPRLVVDARFPVDSADDLRVGQEADLKFPTLHDRSLPVIRGTLTQLSADSLVDSKSGAHFYAAEVELGQAELARLARLRGGQVTIRPGTPAEVLVPLRKRTALEYLLEPLARSLWSATPR